MALLLPDEVSAALRRHAVSCYPEECVGALLSSKGGVIFAKPLANASDAPRTGFSLSARDYLATEREAAKRGLTVLGFYHSHPDAEATPSMRDAETGWAQWWTVIVPVSRVGAGQPRAFRFDERSRTFHE
ncbi:MAG: M67 family metallopeptidase [Myxococcota bacterium]